MNLILGHRSSEIVSFDSVCSYIAFRVFAFNLAGIGATADYMFVSKFTLNKSKPRAISVYFLRKSKEVVHSQEDRDLAGMGQFPIPCACPPLVRW